MDKKIQQLNILLQSIKDIVKSRNCPDWIAKRLTDAVKRAKELTVEETIPINKENKTEYIVDNNYRQFTINENVISNVENDICLYKIVDILDPINGVNLYNLKILKGNKNNPVGMIIHNIPETLLQHIIGNQDI